VKGTAIDFTVVPGAGGATRLILLEGEATLCRGDVDVGRTEAGDGECATAATPCAVLQTSGDEDKRVEEIGIDQGRKQTTIENFPYVRSESTLLEDFKVAGHGCADGGLAGGGLPGTSIPVEPVIVTTVGVAAILFILLTGDSTDSNNNTND
jgi:hypothetical protein